MAFPITKRSFLPAVCASCTWAAASPGATQFLYVDHEVTGGDGSSWPLAFATLQDALAEADAIVSASADDVEILVADGVYFADRGGGAVTGDRAATHLLPDRTRVMGGYAGSSDTAATRDIYLYSTIISGDIGASVDASDNTMHIFRAEGVTDAALDGLTIIQGNADGGGLDDFGAGLTIISSDVEAVDCTFIDHSAGGGGAIASDAGSTLLISRSRFERNLAILGGAIQAIQNDIEILDSTFVDNAAAAGAAMYIDYCETLVEGSSFELNRATGNGGAIFMVLGLAEIHTSDFVDNRGFNGGAMYLDNITEVRVARSVLYRNAADQTGGAVCLKNCGDSPNGLDGVNTLFDRNSALGDGGAILTDGPVTLANSIFDTNTASLGGGAIDFIQTSDGDLRNCTFSGNDAGSGDAILFGSTGTLLVLNTILWGPAAPIADLGLGAVTVSACDIRGGWAGAGGGNITGNPRFVNATTGNFRLRSTSPCIERGRNTFVPADGFDLDNDGNTAERIPLDYYELSRFVDGNADGVARVDIGAAERQ
jgi:predicted outer membrane repeat protein